MDVARRRVYAVERSRSVVEVAQLMTAERVHAVVVVDDGRVAGIVTDRDLVTRVLAPGRPAATAVEDAMTSDPVTVDGDEPVEAVQALLHQHGVRQVPLTCDGRLVGIVALEDLVYELTSELRRLLPEAAPLSAG
jgi:CBS domain-containing protein